MITLVYQLIVLIQDLVESGFD